MPVSIDSVSQGAVSGATSLTISHTVGAGADRALYVFVVGHNSTDLMASGTVSYGGTSLGSRLQGVVETGNGSNFLAVYRLTAPASGTANVVITPSASAFMHAYCVSVAGADQATPEGTIATSPATSVGAASASPVNTSVTLSAGGMAIDMISRRVTASSLTPDAAQTRAGTEQTAGTFATSGASYEAGSGSVTMTWTHAGTNNVSHLVVPVNATASGSTTLTADNGTLVVSGQTTNLLKNLVLSADNLTMLLSGQDATLTKTIPGAYVIVGECGTFTFSGVESYSDIAIKLDHGGFTITGQIARIKYSGDPIVLTKQIKLFVGLKLGL